MIKKLIKLANHLDSVKLTKEADYLDDIIKLALAESFKEAFERANELEAKKLERILGEGVTKELLKEHEDKKSLLQSGLDIENIETKSERMTDYQDAKRLLEEGSGKMDAQFITDVFQGKANRAREKAEDAADELIQKGVTKYLDENISEVASKVYKGALEKLKSEAGEGWSDYVKSTMAKPPAEGAGAFALYVASGVAGIKGKHKSYSDFKNWYFGRDKEGLGAAEKGGEEHINPDEAAYQILEQGGDKAMFVGKMASAITESIADITGSPSSAAAEQLKAIIEIGGKKLAKNIENIVLNSGMLGNGKIYANYGEDIFTFVKQKMSA